jgi:hypothetical protein
MSGERWTADQVSTLRRLWAEGAMVKVIEHEVGKCRTAIKKKRLSLGLPPRHNMTHKTEQIKMYLPADLKRKAGIRAAQRSQSLSAYLTYLVRRDIGG